MEFNKINNLLGPAHDKVPRFITKKWIEVQSQSGSTYNTSKLIRFKTSMLRSDLCDYSDAYIWINGKITVTNTRTIYFVYFKNYRRISRKCRRLRYRDTYVQFTGVQ